MKALSAKATGKPSPTKGSRQRPITRSISKTDGRFHSEQQPWNYSGLLTPEPVGFKFGHFELIDQEIRRVQGYREVRVRCSCGKTKWMSYDNIRTGKSKQCHQCRAEGCRKLHPVWLLNRMRAAKDRCQNRKNPHYAAYGGRGIRFNFKTASDAATWVALNLGLHRSKEIDRKNNNGHYEPGNLRWATHQEQNRNTRRSVLPADFEFDQSQWPYEELTVLRKLRSGLTREQILEQAGNAVAEKRKSWRAIQERLASMTS